MNERGLLGRPAVGMAIGTAASRATGLARTIALASVLGVGTIADAYNTANTAPNMLFALVAGGTLGAALVPMLARDDDPDTRRETASVILGTVTAVAAVVAIAMAIGAPLLMRTLAAGSGGRAEQAELLELGADWMRIFAPQIPLYAVSVIATGIMTAHRRLALGAAAPVATNVITIAGALAFLAIAGSQPRATEIDGLLVAVLGWSTTLAVAAMAAIQLAGARAVVPGLRFAPRRRHPATRELRSVGTWTGLYVIVNQVGLGVVVALASEVTGGVSAYQWAFAVMQLPYAIVAVSIYSAAYPALARIDHDDRVERARQVGRAASATFLLLLPAAVLLVAAAPELATVVVGPDDNLVGAALIGFGLSLIPFSLFQLLARASYGRGDARTPALVNLTVNATMLAVDVVVFTTAGESTKVLTGLALGHAASYVVGCLVLYAVQSRRDTIGPVGWSGRVWRPAVAAIVMTAAVLVTPPIGGDDRVGALLTVAAASFAGGVAYGMSAFALGIRRIAP